LSYEVQKEKHTLWMPFESTFGYHCLKRL